MSESYNPGPPQPAVHYHYDAAQRPAAKNGFCTTALVLGICTFITFGFTGIPAIIFGALGIKQCERGEADARGQAVAGLVCGIITSVLWCLYWCLAIAMGLSASTA